MEIEKDEEEVKDDPIIYDGSKAFDETYNTGFMTNYENDRFYINEAMFKSVFPDLYNALNDLGLLETGTYTYYRNQTKYTKDVVAFIGSIQEVFITSYVNEVFGALEGMNKDDFSSITDSLADDNTNITNFFTFCLMKLIFLVKRKQTF